MPAKKLDYIISCDQWDMEKALASVHDWIDANGKDVELRPYDSAEHDQFAVEMARATKQADRVVLYLTNRYVPLGFTIPVFQAAIASDPQCSGKKVFAVACEELNRTEVVSVLNVMDVFSGTDRERRRRFVEQVIQSKPKPKKRSKADEPPSGVSISQKVGKAQNVIAAGRDVIQPQKHVTRHEFTPDERHISESTAAKVKIAIEELANRTLAEDGKPNFGMWYNRLNKRFKVGTFRAILVKDTEELLSWLAQQKAMNRGKLRRSNPQKYRTDLYSVIWANANGKDMSKADVYEFARVKLNLKKPISSLKSLGPNQLKHLSEFIRRA